MSYLIITNLESYGDCSIVLFVLLVSTGSTLAGVVLLLPVVLIFSILFNLTIHDNYELLRCFCRHRSYSMA